MEKISKMFSSSHLDLSFLGSRKNSNFISFSIIHRGVETRLRLQDNFTYNLNIYFDQDVYFDQGKLQIQIFKLIRNTLAKLSKSYINQWRSWSSARIYIQLLWILNIKEDIGRFLKKFYGRKSLEKYMLVTTLLQSKHIAIIY